MSLAHRFSPQTTRESVSRFFPKNYRKKKTLKNRTVRFSPTNYRKDKKFTIKILLAANCKKDLERKFINSDFLSQTAEKRKKAPASRFCPQTTERSLEYRFSPTNSRKNTPKTEHHSHLGHTEPKTSPRDR